jgi:hypothetical protein
MHRLYFRWKVLRPHTNEGQVEFVHPKWTDYALLSLSIRIGTTNTGKGMWKANPHLVNQQSYLGKIYSDISTFVTKVLVDFLSFPQKKWDRSKFTSRSSRTITVVIEHLGKPLNSRNFKAREINCYANLNITKNLFNFFFLKSRIRFPF